MTDDKPDLSPEQELAARRIRCGIAALRAAAMERGEHPMHGKHAVADLLCDMRAFCEDAGVDFEWCNNEGLRRYTEEQPGDRDM